MWYLDYLSMVPSSHHLTTMFGIGIIVLVRGAGHINRSGPQAYTKRNKNQHPHDVVGRPIITVSPVSEIPTDVETRRDRNALQRPARKV